MSDASLKNTFGAEDSIETWMLKGKEDQKVSEWKKIYCKHKQGVLLEFKNETLAAKNQMIQGCTFLSDVIVHECTVNNKPSLVLRHVDEDAAVLAFFSEDDRRLWARWFSKRAFCVITAKQKHVLDTVMKIQQFTPAEVEGTRYFGIELDWLRRLKLAQHEDGLEDSSLLAYLSNVNTTIRDELLQPPPQLALGGRCKIPEYDVVKFLVLTAWYSANADCAFMFRAEFYLGKICLMPWYSVGKKLSVPQWMVALATQSLEEEKIMIKYSTELRSKQIKCFACLPIKEGKQTVGVLCLANTDDAKQISKKHADLLDQVIQNIAFGRHFVNKAPLPTDFGFYKELACTYIQKFWRQRKMMNFIHGGSQTKNTKRYVPSPKSPAAPKQKKQQQEEALSTSYDDEAPTSEFSYAFNESSKGTPYKDPKATAPQDLMSKTSGGGAGKWQQNSMSRPKPNRGAAFQAVVMKKVELECVQAKLTLDISIEDFVEEDFSNNIAKSLGVDPSTVEIRSVSGGSVVVDFVVKVDPAESKINMKSFEEKAASGSLDAGYPAQWDTMTTSVVVCTVEVKTKAAPQSQMTYISAITKMQSSYRGMKTREETDKLRETKRKVNEKEMRNQMVAQMQDDMYEDQKSRMEAKMMERLEKEKAEQRKAKQMARAAQKEEVARRKQEKELKVLQDQQQKAQQREQAALQAQEDQIKLEIQQKLGNIAANRIQSCFKLYHGEKQKSAMLIQRVVKLKAAKEAAVKQRERFEEEAQIKVGMQRDSAVVIQTRFRGLQARKDLYSIIEEYSHAYIPPWINWCLLSGCVYLYVYKIYNPPRDTQECQSQMEQEGMQFLDGHPGYVQDVGPVRLIYKGGLHDDTEGWYLWQKILPFSKEGMQDRAPLFISSDNHVWETDQEVVHFSLSSDGYGSAASENSFTVITKDSPCPHEKPDAAVSSKAKYRLWLSQSGGDYCELVEKFKTERPQSMPMLGRAFSFGKSHDTSIPSAPRRVQSFSKKDLKQKQQKSALSWFGGGTTTTTTDTDMSWDAIPREAIEHRFYAMMHVGAALHILSDRHKNSEEESPMKGMFLTPTMAAAKKIQARGRVYLLVMLDRHRAKQLSEDATALAVDDPIEVAFKERAVVAQEEWRAQKSHQEQEQEQAPKEVDGAQTIRSVWRTEGSAKPAAAADSGEAELQRLTTQLGKPSQIGQAKKGGGKYASKFIWLDKGNVCCDKKGQSSKATASNALTQLQDVQLSGQSLDFTLTFKGAKKAETLFFKASSAEQLQSWCSLLLLKCKSQLTDQCVNQLQSQLSGTKS